MKTNTIITIVLVGVVTISLAACSKSEAPTQKITEQTEPPKPPKQQQPTTPPLDREALALVEKAFSERWIQVGDSWFIIHQYSIMTTWLTPDLIQIKGATFHVSSRALSEADTLNGLQWKGQVELLIRLQRVYGLGENSFGSKFRQWSKWEDAPDGRMVRANSDTSYTLEKKNGQWEINAPGYYHPGGNRLTKPSEEEIKKILAQ